MCALKARQRVVGAFQEHHHRDEGGPALGRRTLTQGSQQLGDIVLRAGARPGVARGVQSRPAAQRIHHQSGIIGQSGQTGQASTVARLQQRVLDEGGGGFFRHRQAQTQGIAQFDRHIGQQRAQLAQLAGIVAGQQQSGGRGAHQSDSA